MNKHCVKNPWGLTHRQVDVMDQLCAFGCQKTAAERLGMGEAAISTHAARARHKMGVPNTILAALAWRDWRRGAGRLEAA